MSGATIPFVLSILDQAPIAADATAGDALRNSLRLAQLAESLQYHRFWIAEHHGTPMLACLAPEVLVAAIASQTRGIRVGSGGVLLAHYNAFKVAEVFSVLAALFPGRIDLGIGRATGGAPAVVRALGTDMQSAAPEAFGCRLRSLLQFLRDEAGDDDSSRNTLPRERTALEVWLLGSSPQSAALAAELRLPYAFADFITPRCGGATSSYRQLRQDDAAARVIVAVAAICADTDEEAWELATSSLVFTRLAPAEYPARVPSPAAARRLLAEHAQPTDVHTPGRRTIIGSGQTVRSEIEAVAAEYGADEVMIVTTCYSEEARRRSYELIAESFRR